MNSWWTAVRMKLQSKAPQIVLAAFELMAFAVYTRLLIVNSLRVHEPRTFGDSPDYLRIANLPLFSPKFWTDNRAAVTPLFYKLVGDDPNRIFAFQLCFSIVSWGILALVVTYAIRSYYLKAAAFAVVLAFSLSRDIFMWDPFVGSESVALSTIILFVACALWLVIEWKRYKIPIFIITAFLMAFSRDSSAYLLLMTAGVLLPFCLFSNLKFDLLILIVSFVAIFSASIYAANLGMRQYTNIVNVTAFRVFPNPEYVDFFKNLGMPVDESLVEQSHYSLIPGYPKWAVFAALLFDPKQEDFRAWVKRNGMQAYLRFLWFFKADTLQKMFYEDAGRNVFYPDVYYYTATGYRPILTDQRLAEILYPSRLGLLFFFLANIFAALACGPALSMRKFPWLVPILMIFFTYPQAFLVWNGDANDVPRHSIEHNVTERLGFWILLFFAIDFLFQVGKPFFEKFWAGVRARLAYSGSWREWPLHK